MGRATTKRDALPSGMAVAAKRTVLYGQYHNITPPPPRHTLPRHSNLHPTPPTPRHHPTSLRLGPSKRHSVSIISPSTPQQPLTNPPPSLNPLVSHHPHHLHTRPHPTLLRTLHRPPNTRSYQRRRTRLSGFSASGTCVCEVEEGGGWEVVEGVRKRDWGEGGEVWG